MEGDLEKAVYWISQMLAETDAPGSEGSQNGSAPFPQEAVAHLNLARLKLAQGRFDESESHLDLALQRCRMFHLRELQAETLEALGNLYRERGDATRALDFYDEASRAYRDAGLSLTDRELLDERATFYLQAGQI